ncbi:DUF3995 domain-containing protein [Sinomonas sp. P47F7]|uniref:DUF3995 domain-containing protein n=1 Tax=Sinomonas sp. P47F7 TaxID=3410987 RepID=UPI003BF4C8CB
MRRVAPGALALLWVAAALGLFHAAWSAYWAPGGTVMADSVGAWATDWARSAPGLASLALWGIAAVKAAAAVVPLLSELGRVPGRRLWRVVSWIGGTGLVLYGGLNVVVGAAVLTGVIPASGVEYGALRAHVFLWDPAFALWGAALCAALVITRGANPRRAARLRAARRDS